MWFREELTRLRQRGSRAAIAVGLADVATLAAAREAWQPAARLFAKAEALLKTEAAAFSLPARDHYERAHARATEALGDSAQAVAAAGRALTLEQALAEADAVLTLDRAADGGRRILEEGMRLVVASSTHKFRVWPPDWARSFISICVAIGSKGYLAVTASTWPPSTRRQAMPGRYLG